MKFSGGTYYFEILGQEKMLAESELIAVLEQYYAGQVVTKNTIAPTEGIWFDVDSQAIDETLFQNKRKDKRQERTRKWIVKALREAKKNPLRYGKFQTLMPKKTWEKKTVIGLITLAFKLGDTHGDWVMQGLEWAQRIQNGESWETLCNKHDTVQYTRLIVWKDGHLRMVGGQSNTNCIVPPTAISGKIRRKEKYQFSSLIPLVVRYVR